MSIAAGEMREELQSPNRKNSSYLESLRLIKKHLKASRKTEAQKNTMYKTRNKLNYSEQHRTITPALERLRQENCASMKVISQ